MKIVYETKDWIEASLLVTFEFQMVGMAKTNGVCYFKFDKPDEANSVLEKYWKDQLDISARKFVDSQRRIKDLIFNAPVRRQI
jgi:hypothetical protein